MPGHKKRGAKRLGFKFKRLGTSTKARDDSGSARTRRSTRGTGDNVSAAAVDTAQPAPSTSRSTDRRRPATRGPATSGKRGRTAAAAAATASSPSRAEVPADQRGQKRRRRGSHDTYTGAATTDVELPPTSYTGDAALHCLLQNAMAAELAATAACYDGGAKAYVHTALKQVAGTFASQVSTRMIKSVQRLKHGDSGRVVPNPANVQLRRRHRDLEAALARLLDEQAKWVQAAAPFTRAPRVTAADLRRMRAAAPPAGPGQLTSPSTTLAPSLPKTAAEALEGVDVGVSQIAAATRIADATHRRGSQVASTLSSRFYSESFRNVPNHEQPMATVRELQAHAGASTAFAGGDGGGKAKGGGSGGRRSSGRDRDSRRTSGGRGKRS